MPPIKSPVCAKGHPWSGTVKAGNGRTRNVCHKCQAENRRIARLKNKHK